MTRTDDSLFLPNVNDIKTVEDAKEWMRRASSMLSSNQQNIKSDLDARIDNTSNALVKGTKTFTSLKLNGSQDCNKQQMVSMVIENRMTDPSNPVVGQIWLRTDLI